MKKQLPNIFKGEVKCNNNLKVAHATNQERTITPRQTINEMFKKNKMYKQEVEIETDSDNIKTKIIGRTEDHIITINNNVIKIDNIKKINILDNK